MPMCAMYPVEIPHADKRGTKIVWHFIEFVKDVHGSAPPIAGKNIANPFGAILTGAMMLEHLGLSREAARIEESVLEAVRQKKTTTDIGGTLGTKEAAEWVLGAVAGR